MILINIVWTLAVNIRGMDLFSLHPNTRQLYAILLVAGKDSGAFMVIAIFVTYVFAVVSLYQSYMSQEVVEIHFLEQMGVVFSDTLGGFEVPGVGTKIKHGAWMIFIMLQTIMNIIILNTLIAILGDSYDNVMNE